MTDRIEKELLLRASPEDVWEAVTGPGWLAEDVYLNLRPGGDASFGAGRTGWVEEASPPTRLAFWWAEGGEPATRVEITIRTAGKTATRLRVVESRPLEMLGLFGMPLPGTGHASSGPALVAA